MLGVAYRSHSQAWDAMANATEQRVHSLRALRTQLVTSASESLEGLADPSAGVVLLTPRAGSGALGSASASPRGMRRQQTANDALRQQSSNLIDSELSREEAALAALPTDHVALLFTLKLRLQPLMECVLATAQAYARDERGRAALGVPFAEALAVVREALAQMAQTTGTKAAEAAEAEGAEAEADVAGRCVQVEGGEGMLDASLGQWVDSVEAVVAGLVQVRRCIRKCTRRRMHMPAHAHAHAHARTHMHACICCGRRPGAGASGVGQGARGTDACQGGIAGECTARDRGAAAAAGGRSASDGGPVRRRARVL